MDDDANLDQSLWDALDTPVDPSSDPGVLYSLLSPFAGLIDSANTEIATIPFVGAASGAVAASGNTVGVTTPIWIYLVGAIVILFLVAYITREIAG